MGPIIALALCCILIPVALAAAGVLGSVRKEAKTAKSFISPSLVDLPAGWRLQPSCGFNRSLSTRVSRSSQ